MDKKPNMTNIDALFDKVKWKETEEEIPTDSSIPYATHEGILEIGDIKLRVYILNTGQKVINKEDMESLFSLIPVHTSYV